MGGPFNDGPGEKRNMGVGTGEEELREERGHREYGEREERVTYER